MANHCGKHPAKQSLTPYTRIPYQYMELPDIRWIMTVVFMRTINTSYYVSSVIVLTSGLIASYRLGRALQQLAIEASAASCCACGVHLL